MSGILDHLEKLVGFKGVADLQSFHRAAAQLHVSQPSLSSSIKILESTVGHALFVRSHKGVTLTPEGAVLLEFTNRLVHDIRSLEANLASNSSELVGNLRIGLYESIAIYFWPGFFRRFREAHPKLGLSLTTGRSAALVERLEQQELDIVVTVEPKRSRRLRAIVLYTDRFCFYTSPKIARRLKAIVKPGANARDVQQALTDIPVILFPSAANRYGQTLGSSLAESGFAMGQLYEVESFEAAKEIAASEIGVALLPTKVATSSIEARRLVTVEMPGFDPATLGEHGVHMVTIENSHQSRLITAVSAALVQHLGSQKSAY